MSRDSFCTGRWIIGFLALLTGLQMLYNGQASYDESLHEFRKTFYPNTLATNPVCSGTKLTWEEFNLYAIKGEAALFIISGALILLNRKCTGSLFLVAAVTFIFIVKDLPWLRHSTLKSTRLERNEKLIDILKNLSMLGAAILLMTDKGTARIARKQSVKKVEEKTSQKVQAPQAIEKKKKKQ